MGHWGLLLPAPHLGWTLLLRGTYLDLCHSLCFGSVEGSSSPRDGSFQLSILCLSYLAVARLPVGDSTAPLFVPSALFQKLEKPSPPSLCAWPCSAYQNRPSLWWIVSPSSATPCTDRPSRPFLEN